MLLTVNMRFEQFSLSMFVRATANKTRGSTKKTGGGGKVKKKKKDKKDKPKDI